MYLKIRQLRVFESVARHLNFTRAAEELHLSQPAVSMQVKQLETAVGLALFEHVGKKTFLTEAGRTLAETCREVFDRLAHFEMAAEELKGMKRGRLRLAVISTAEYFAPRLIGPFCERFPGIDVSLEVNNRERVLRRLEQNLDDLYILGQPPDGLDVEYVPFMENPLVVVARDDHPLAKARTIPLERIAREPFIVRESGSGTRIATERKFQSSLLRIKVRMELGSNEAIKQAIAAGLGISVLSRHTLVLETTAGKLTILDVEGFPIKRNWYLVYPKGKKLSIVAQTFHDYLKTGTVPFLS